MKVAGNTQGDCAMFNVEANSISAKRVLSGGHKASIRSFVSSSSQDGSIITGGEDSRLCEWELNGKKNTQARNATSAAMSYSLSTHSAMPREGGGRIRRQKSKKAHAPY